MKKPLGLFAAIIVPMALAACTVSRFTTSNIMQVHEGMTSAEVRSLFGDPTNIRSSNCSFKYTCRIWEYDSPDVDAQFEFESKEQSWILKDFDIRRD